MYDIDIIWEVFFPEEEKNSLTEQLREGIEETLRRFSAFQDAEVSLTLVNDVKIRELNREYRGIDQPTDVLSFALTEKMEEEPEVIGGEDQALGDIVISLERAREQAQVYGHSFARETVYLAVHGTLHLLGYDHEEDRKKSEMREKEEEVMAAFGLARK